MKTICFVLILFVLGNCRQKSKIIEEGEKTSFKCDSCIEIYGFYFNQSSPNIFMKDELRRGDLNDTLFQGIHCEVYDISKKNMTLLIEQSKKNGCVKLPIKNIHFPILAKYLDDSDTGYYINKHAGGIFFGFDRYLILNLSKKYFIWFQKG